jgi:iron complex transport system ATP-binding protein
MAIIVKDLTFGYGEKNVLDHLDFRVPPGKFTAVLGKNGSGKSTLLRLIAGFIKPKSGSIEVFGTDANRLSITERAKQIGFLSQSHYPVFPFTVEEVVLTGRAAYIFSTPTNKDREKAENAIRRVGIEVLRKRPYTELSGGERQLVLIARVLAQEPKIMLLDEPLSSLDLSNQAKMLNLLKGLVASGLTVVAVLHDPNVAFRYGDNFIFLKNGEIREPEELNGVLNSRVLTDVYGVKIEMVPFRNRFLIVSDPESIDAKLD